MANDTTPPGNCKVSHSSPLKKIRTQIPNTAPHIKIATAGMIAT